MPTKKILEKGKKPGKKNVVTTKKETNSSKKSVSKNSGPKGGDSMEVDVPQTTKPNLKKRQRDDFDSDIVDPTPKKSQNEETALILDTTTKSTSSFPRGGAKSLDPIEIRDVQKQVELDFAQGKIKVNSLHIYCIP
jgi:hypothetical protein